MRPALLALMLAAVLAPARLSAQSILDLLETIRTGGGWVEIPIRHGRGTLDTRTLPTGGMKLEGCMQVYAGHTGRWELHARDPLGDGALDVTVKPGEPRPFSYATGSQGRLHVEARWSEPRDTTLLVWVGLKSPLQPRRDPCAPEYGNG